MIIEGNKMKQIEDYRLILENIDLEKLFRQAEEAMEGMLVLNGTGPEPVFVGIPPRWEENPCGVGGYTWTMSRLKYMVTLCKAFLLNGERRYLDKVEADLADWFEQVPPPPVPVDYESACVYHGVHNWRMLELGYRMVYTFPVLLGVLQVYGQNQNLIRRIRDSIAEHAERIAAGSHLLWPEYDHNHYTQEINGLLAAVSMIPEHPRVADWLDQAMEGLERACANQITEDGAQIEGAAEYHSAVVIDFCYSLCFAKSVGRSFSPEFVERVRKGLDFSIHTMGPDGNLLPFGDSDSRLYTPVQAAAMSFVLFDDRRHLATLRQFMPDEWVLHLVTELCPWGLDRIPQLLAWLKQPMEQESPNLLPVCSYQRQMDQYIVRSGWSQKDACLFFSCHSPIHYGNHAHMDQLGILFGAHGKMLLQDPGRYTYKDCEDRHLYKSSQVHSMPTIDGRDAFEYLGTFTYGPQKEGAITAIMDTKRIQGVCGWHRNYDPVTVSRSAALVDGHILVIADTFQHVRGENMKVYFHLNSTCVTRENADFVTGDSGVNIRICSLLPESEIQTELLEGRLSDVFYHDYPSRRAVYSRKADQDTETLFFIAIPFLAGESDRIEEFAWENGILSFGFRGTSYRMAFHNGIFSEV